MYKLAVKESLDRKFKRLRTKDKELLRLVEKKVNDILVDPYRFKPLRNLCRTNAGFTWEDLLSRSMR
jgi:mRNA-degrading endonuclease RelE of RelBE toxin-antitoxin system